MKHIRVGVIRGGKGGEYDVSLRTGASVLKHLPERFERRDILVSKDGTWYCDGVKISQKELADKIDVAFIALHGEYGEDGKIQAELSQFHIPFTGSGVFPSAVAMHKALSREVFLKAGLKVARAMYVSKGDDVAHKALHIFRSFPQPCIVKPATAGSSVGITIARDFETLIQGINDALLVSDTAMVEEFIKGKEATCGVIESFRDEDLYALPPVEIRLPPHCEFFDFNAKYDGKTEEVCPGKFTKQEKEEIMKLAQKIHSELGLRHYSRSDFIVSPHGVYVLEVNTLPGLTEASLFPKELEAVGASLSEFLEHVIELALKRR